MSMAERCDEIIRLIDRVLAETGPTPSVAPKGGQSGRCDR